MEDYGKHLQLAQSFWEMTVNKINNSTMLVNGMGALILHEKVWKHKETINILTDLLFTPIFASQVKRRNTKIETINILTDFLFTPIFIKLNGSTVWKVITCSHLNVITIFQTKQQISKRYESQLQEESLKTPCHASSIRLLPDFDYSYSLITPRPHMQRRSHTEANQRRRSCGRRAYSLITSGPHLQWQYMLH